MMFSDPAARSAAPLAPKFVLAAGVIAFCVIARWAPLPPNFAPMLAAALYVGARSGDLRLGAVVILSALLVSDMVIGFYDFGVMAAVYAATLLPLIAGRGMARSGLAGPAPVALWGVASALQFFLITNFAVWLGAGAYPTTLAGLTACYVAALPFLINTLAGTLTFSALFFGAEAALRAWRSRSIVA